MLKRWRPKPRPGRLKGADMSRLRDIVWERSRGHCERCGRPIVKAEDPIRDDSYHLAHKRNKRMWGDTPENSAAECGKCHRRFHAYGPSMTKPVPKKG